MKILPILLINNTIEELPIIIYDCDEIIIEHLTCIYPGNPAISACTLHFSGTEMSYVGVESSFRRSVFYIDGIRNNSRSFHIHSPCNLKFMLSCNTLADPPVPAEELRFLLHLSLKLKNPDLKKLKTQGA